MGIWPLTRTTLAQAVIVSHQTRRLTHAGPVFATESIELSADASEAGQETATGTRKDAFRLEPRAPGRTRTSNSRQVRRHVQQKTHFR